MTRNVLFSLLLAIMVGGCGIEAAQLTDNNSTQADSLGNSEVSNIEIFNPSFTPLAGERSQFGLKINFNNRASTINQANGFWSMSNGDLLEKLKHGATVQPNENEVLDGYAAVDALGYFSASKPGKGGTVKVFGLGSVPTDVGQVTGDTRERWRQFVESTGVNYSASGSAASKTGLFFGAPAFLSLGENIPFVIIDPETQTDITQGSIDPNKTLSVTIYQEDPDNIDTNPPVSLSTITGGRKSVFGNRFGVGRIIVELKDKLDNNRVIKSTEFNIAVVPGNFFVTNPGGRFIYDTHVRVGLPQLQGNEVVFPVLLNLTRTGSVDKEDPGYLGQSLLRGSSNQGGTTNPLATPIKVLFDPRFGERWALYRFAVAGSMTSTSQVTLTGFTYVLDMGTGASSRKGYPADITQSYFQRNVSSGDEFNLRVDVPRISNGVTNNNGNNNNNGNTLPDAQEFDLTQFRVFSSP